MKYGQELLDELKVQLAEHEKTSRADQLRRFEEQPDDCSMIIHNTCDGLTTQMLNAKITILENGGLGCFPYWADKDGNRADIKWVNTKFGGAFMIKNGETVSFTSSVKKLNALGYSEKTENVSAWACNNGHGGHGFADIQSVSVEIFKSNTNYWTGK